MQGEQGNDLVGQSPGMSQARVSDAISLEFISLHFQIMRTWT